MSGLRMPSLLVGGWIGGSSCGGFHQAVYHPRGSGVWWWVLGYDVICSWVCGTEGCSFSDVSMHGEAISSI